MRTVFLVSPARCSGDRAKTLVRSKTARLGACLREGTATLGSVMYFRGRLGYAQQSGDALIMAQGLGLRAADMPLDVPTFRAMGRVSTDSRKFTRALQRDARLVAEDARVVLLGSIATTKYISTLLDVFGERLLFPETFVGRGDMSRGGLLLRATRAREELVYVPVLGAVRRGVRPPKLPRRSTTPASDRATPLDQIALRDHHLGEVVAKGAHPHGRA